MPANPFIDLRCFLTGNTNDYMHQGGWRYVILALFWVLTIAAIGMAERNWQKDPTQRTGRHLGVWVFRVSSAACGFRACCGSCRCRRPMDCNTGLSRNQPMWHSSFIVRS
ncbi:hypothetical protein [Bradyrhizobium sp. CB1015]|uniref:hypothetical protein n=1 Tax=Bradyrhizobium sp. CB1015 TaxID=2976822 RepID=UPI0021A9DA70|nr:hypothetical protein [Bradyrhizobium sp. CB1015]UWU94316.1 hypothetical protein N2604_10940 [Bradyrhizobium sp. CB1015]